jgi:beta-glucuronidase
VWHRCVVWLDGVQVAEHVGGYLPFECEVSGGLVAGAAHRLTVAVSNELDYASLPHGDVIEHPAEGGAAARRRLRVNGDVYPHAGLHRSVWLYATSAARVMDFTLRTRLTAQGAQVNFVVEHDGNADARVNLRLRDSAGREVGCAEGVAGVLTLKTPELWSPERPALHEVEITLSDARGAVQDVYRQPVGLRTIAVREGRLELNGRPYTLRGFGKSEDTPLRGKAFDPVMALRDLQLLRWTGANSIRTGHHPFAEEFLQLADRVGLAVIEETAALSIWIPEDEAANDVAAKDSGWRPAAAPLSEEQARRHTGLREATLAYHREHLRAMIARDKNHACVLLWSLGNEVDTSHAQSRAYFAEIAAAARAADPSRPITKVECLGHDETQVAEFVDVVSVNRYYGWYSDPGDLDVIEPQLTAELTRWHERHGKPVLLAEFGADAIAGLHQTPPVMFSEEYQAELIERYLAVCARLPFVIGAHVWTFADFLTAQGVKRVDGNKKGVFTRERRPKLAAHRLRARWVGGAAGGV